MTSEIYNKKKEEYVTYLCTLCGITKGSEVRQIRRMSLPVLEKLVNSIRMN